MISIERVGRSAVLTLSRPPVNAFNAELSVRLEDAFKDVSADESITVLHIRSDQKAFCAGADLSLMRSCFSSGGIDAMLDVVRRMQRIFERFEAAPVLTIAEIGGAAVGGGLELALACDLRVAAEEAKLGLPEVTLGLLPGAGGTQRLTRLCGQAIAKRLILGGEVVNGAEAQRLGIVQWSQPRAQLEAWTRELVARYAALPRAALAACKSCITAEGDAERNGFAEEISGTRALYQNPETRRLVSEFLERSK